MLNFFFVLIILLSLAHVYRIIIGPSVWDRLLGLNLFSVHIILTILFYAVLKELYYIVDIAIVFVLLGFIGTIFMARFVEKGGKL